MKYKKVELSELFYDLIYVYTISQLSGLLEHVSDDVIKSYSFLIFIIYLTIFVNTWMIQMVFTNRFGKQRLRDL